MKKFVLFLILAITITGLLSPSILSNSFASPEDAPGRDQGTKTAAGCDKGTAKNNPNCGTTEPPGDSDNDGIPDSEDACPLIPNLFNINDQPDHDGDGIVDKRDKTPCPI